MTIPISRQFSEVPKNYPLDEESSWWGIVLPEAGVNLVENPFFEGTEEPPAGYTPTNCTIRTFYNDATRDWTLQAARGRPAAFVDWTSGDSTVSYGFPAALPPGVYSFSADIYAEKESVFWLLMNGIAPQKAVTLKRGWHRISYTMPLSVNLVQVAIRCFGSSNWHTQAWQVEAKNHDTTPIYGGMEGFTHGQHVEYYWQGVGYASKSIRTGETRHGGKIVYFDELGLETVAVQGLTMPSYNWSGETRFRTLEVDNRQVSLVLELCADNFEALARKKAQIARLLSPVLVPDGQPLWLVHRTEAGERLFYACRYSGGFEGNIDNFYQERLTLRFEGAQDYLEEEFGAGSFCAEIYGANAAPGELYVRQFQKSWVGYDLPITDAGAGAVISPMIIGSLPDGKGNVLAYGDFAPSGGSGARFIGKLNLSTSVWSSVNFNQSPNDAVWSVDIHPQSGHQIIAGGEFTGWVLEGGGGGAGSAQYLARFTGATWTTVGGVQPNNAVRSVLVHPSGDIYVGGTFTTPFPKFGRYVYQNFGTTVWDTMTPIASLGGTVVSKIVLGDRSNVYFLTDWVDGTGAGRVIRYEPDTGEWETIGDSLDALATSLVSDRHGRVFIAGTFIGKIGRWTGTAWDMSIGTLFTEKYGAVDWTLLGFDNEGMLYVQGAGAGIDPFVVRYDGSRIIPSDIQIGIGAGSVGNRHNISTISASWDTGDFIPRRQVTTVNVTSFAPVRPVFVFRGICSPIEIANLSTGQTIRFQPGKSYTESSVVYPVPSLASVFGGDRAVIAPGELASVRTLYGNIDYTVDPSSDIYEFMLLPGENHLAITASWHDATRGEINGSGAVCVVWNGTHLGIEGGY